MLTMILTWLKRPARGNVAVEFALITALFVLPLLLGASDFVGVIAAQAQLNTALQALYYYAVNNRGTVTTDTTSIMSAINANSDFQLTLDTPSVTYVCYTTQTSATTAPSFGSSSTTNSCTTGQTTMTYVTYKVSTKVALPVPVPFMSNPLPLSATGQVQVATANN